MADTHIKIKPVTPRVQYTGNGSTTVFPYSFPIFDESEMVVYEGDDVITTGYTVSGAGQTDGGNVTFSIAPADGTKITLLRNVSIERMTDFQEGGTFRPKNINDELDRQTAFMQQVQEKVDRTLILPPTSDVDPSQILGEVVRIYDSIDNIDAVADDLTNVDAVAGDLTNIDAVAGDLTNIDAVADDLTNIDSVAADLTNIDAVNANKTNIDAVAWNQANIDTVAVIASDVSTVASNASGVSNVSSNMSDVNDCVTNMAAIQDAPNQAQAAADSAALSAQYANDKINQTHITNCITYIPQDVKFELDSGIFTLKAGSKVYVPNGFESDGTTPKFDVITIESDISVHGTAPDTSTRLFYYRNGNLGVYSSSASGTTTPTSSGNVMFYNTSDNTLKRYNNGSVADSGWSFPLGRVTADGTNLFGEIDQVFNGFGCIGSTVYILPGVKGLIPNGRNSDGTLKSIEFTVSNVLKTSGNIGTNSRVVLTTDGSTGVNFGQEAKCFITSRTVGFQTSGYYYNTATNIAKKSLSTSTDWDSCRDEAIIGYCTTDSNGITDFSPRTVLKALDWNDKETIAGWGMSSGKMVNLTVLTSGSTYTSPANGWFTASMARDSASWTMGLANSAGPSMKGTTNTNNNTNNVQAYIPAKKGDTITFGYSGTSPILRFYYAEGENV